MEILKLKPAVKDYIWGGTRLKEDFSVETDLERVAESWVMSCHPNGACVVKNGEFEGQILHQVIRENPDFLGTHANDYDGFPILVKLIDAHDNLSVQVHPDDDYAAEVEDTSGKTEMWYVVDCEEDASIICGFSEELTVEQFRQAILNGTLLDYVHRYNVKKGDVFLIEAGTLHAIGKGTVIAEIQQSSDITYRVYDYDRTDDEGNARELHIDKAIDVAITAPPADEPGPAGEETEVENHTEKLLADCEYFRTRLCTNSDDSSIFVDGTSFACILVVEGKAEFDGIELECGECAFVPAGYGSIKVTGEAEYLLTTV